MESGFLFETEMDSRPSTAEAGARDGAPRIILEKGRALARGFARALRDEKRIAFARSFCEMIIRHYWFGLQKGVETVWPLPGELAPYRRVKLDKSAAFLSRSMAEAAVRLDPLQAGYFIGVTYTAMLPDEMRSRLGVYYTPPAVARRLIDLATAAGVDWQSCSVLDPACGGGAFLSPLARKIIDTNANRSPRELVEAIGRRLHGWEIDPFAAWASQVFLEAGTMPLCRKAGLRLAVVAEIRDSLATDTAAAPYDLVIGNPPYGRLRLKPEIRRRYQRSLYGHANLYGLFTDLAIQLSRVGGVIAYVTPTSFLAGEYFKSLRALLAGQAPPASIDFVSVRKGVFADALQETLLATYKRGGGQSTARVHFISPGEGDTLDVESAGTFSLPEHPGSPWLIPRAAAQQRLTAILRALPYRLRDYGYQVSTGPLVWNRHKDQLASRPGPRTLPLIWAESVSTDGRFVFRAEKKNHQPYFRPKPGDEWLISRRPCVLLQRTTAKEQNRRLIAAELPQRFVEEHGAVVIENHLNMIRPINGAPAVSADLLAAFLNTAIVDRAFRCLSGSVAVSAYELEDLPLPEPKKLAGLAELLRAAASPEEVEKFCASLFSERAPE